MSQVDVSRYNFILTFHQWSKKFKKEYIAILNRTPFPEEGTICAPIARKENSIMERTISPTGEIAITHYSVIKKFSGFSLVHFELETGRTHQIRVHCKYIGTPIVGDTLYGTPSPYIARQALHAYRISFVIPYINKPLSLQAPIPEDMRLLLQRL